MLKSNEHCLPSKDHERMKQTDRQTEKLKERQKTELAKHFWMEKNVERLNIKDQDILG